MRSVQAQRSRFDLSWYLFLRCATAAARFPSRLFGRACLPLILDAPDCICSLGRLLLGVVQSGATAEWRHAQVISIHAPHTGCDYEDINLLGRYREFQSTHSIRGATSVSWSIPRLPVRFQSTHPIRGATAVEINFSTYVELFQSTHPIRGATVRMTYT